VKVLSEGEWRTFVVRHTYQARRAG
jgi:hypothetical protein